GGVLEPAIDRRLVREQADATTAQRGETLPKEDVETGQDDGHAADGSAAGDTMRAMARGLRYERPGAGRGNRASGGRDRRRARGGARAARVRARTGDVVVGVSASGVTPFVRGALTAARRAGARTVLVTCGATRARADITIAPAPGPEVLAGSTRLKAGTATKLVLNTLTTATMARLGKVYGNRMVDLQPRSAKLRERAVRLIAEIAGVRPPLARRALAGSGGSVRVAI